MYCFVLSVARLLLLVGCRFRLSVGSLHDALTELHVSLSALTDILLQLSVSQVQCAVWLQGVCL